MIKSFAVTNNLNERLDLVLTKPEESGIVVKSVTGLGPGKVTLHIKEIANGDGGSYGGGRLPVRNIVMNLAFLGNPTIEDTRQLTYRFFPLNKPITLTVLTDNLEVNIDGYVESNEPDIFSNLEGCQISILCPNPYFYTERDQTSVSFGSYPMLEFPIDNELIEGGDEYLEETEGSSEKIPDNIVKKSPFHYSAVAENVTATVSAYDWVADNLYGDLPFLARSEEKVMIPTFGYDMYIEHTFQCLYLNWTWSRDFFKEDSKYTLTLLIDAEIPHPEGGTGLRDKIYQMGGAVYIYCIVDIGNGNMLETLGDLRNKSLNKDDKILATCYIGDDGYLKYEKTTNYKIDIDITKEILDDLYDENSTPSKYIRVTMATLTKNKAHKILNIDGFADDSEFYTEKAKNICRMLVHDVKLGHQSDSLLNIDKTMPNHTITQNGINYNLQVSEGIIMGELLKYGFKNTVVYEGNASIGFQMTIGFSHSMLSFDDDGLVDDPGYIIITSTFYPKKKMVIDLQKVYEIIQSSSDDNQVIPITQPGDQIIIDTRKKRKTIRYQKPYDYSHTDANGNVVPWDLAGYKINILAASNRDIAWFELHQGVNEFTVRHAMETEIELEENLNKVHSEYLEVEIRNKVYYEGV